MMEKQGPEGWFWGVLGGFGVDFVNHWGEKRDGNHR
jgi:hypothetical protein